jgi:hypothetical protein
MSYLGRELTCLIYSDWGTVARGVSYSERGAINGPLQNSNCVDGSLKRTLAWKRKTRCGSLAHLVPLAPRGSQMCASSCDYVCPLFSSVCRAASCTSHSTLTACRPSWTLPLSVSHSSEAGSARPYSQRRPVAARKILSTTRHCDRNTVRCLLREVTPARLILPGTWVSAESG